MKKTTIKYTLFLSAIFFFSCKKLVRIPEPINTITTKETFGALSTANSAIAGIYQDMSRLNSISSTISVYSGMSADELVPFGTGNNPYYLNRLLYNDNTVGSFWTSSYTDIYMSNAAIEGLQASSSIPVANKTQLMGEAKFLRAYCYFYLVNLFGDVPLVLSTSWERSAVLPRAPVAQVYQQIIADLQDAQNTLPSDYAIAGGERIRANKWAATALLARVYLYNSKWPEAETQSTTVITNHSLFTLTTDLTTTFLKNNNEAIFQIQAIDPGLNFATPEGHQFLVYPGNSPSYYFNSPLLESFEPGDLRLANWADSVLFSGTLYYYPYKYKVLVTTQDNITEYETLLRLSEQFLIRAEARAEQGKLTEAIADLDTVRNRAGLPDLSSSLNQTQILAAVAKERQTELFSEIGHRWFDLKRTGQATAVLSPIKPFWKSYQQLYPIPMSERQTDPNLTQNPGY